MNDESFDVEDRRYSSASSRPGLNNNRLPSEYICSQSLSPRERLFFVAAAEIDMTKLHDRMKTMRFKARQWEFLRDCWHLTPREVQVARLMCEGCDNEQIAGELHIAYNTVRVHLGHICGKVGVRGRAALIVEFADVLQRAGR